MLPFIYVLQSDENNKCFQTEKV